MNITEFIFSILLSFLLGFLSCIFGIKYSKILLNQTVENTLKKILLFTVIRTVIITVISFLLIKFNFVHTKLFLILVFIFYFIFKIIEIVQINTLENNKKYRKISKRKFFK